MDKMLSPEGNIFDRRQSRLASAHPGPRESNALCYADRILPCLAVVLASYELADAARAEPDAVELAKKLANPVSSLISLPLQLNFDDRIGALDEGSRVSFNIQPVIPISLNDDWNLISRTILPLVRQENVVPGSGSQSGIGDTVQSLFFSPADPSAGGWVWGAGPALLLPTATDQLLGARKWGAGPTAVALRQQGPWTYGFLLNHIWSFAGDSKRDEVNSTFVQPFVGYTTPAAWSFDLQTETTYDWENQQWNVPLVFLVSKVTSVGSQLIQVQAGPRYYARHLVGGPEGLSFRIAVTLLFPR